MNKPKLENNEEEDIKDDGEVLQKAYEFIPKGLCQFKQRGPYIVCVSCEIQHAIHIGMSKIMIGEDATGRPILKDRSKQE